MKHKKKQVGNNSRVSDFLRCGYNYDSTSMRLQFDRATTTTTKHNYHLPICKYELYKRSFIVRRLFNFNFKYQ